MNDIESIIRLFVIVVFIQNPINFVSCWFVGNLFKVKFVRKIGSKCEPDNGDEDNIALLVKEIFPKHSQLIFCPTK